MTGPRQTLYRLRTARYHAPVNTFHHRHRIPSGLRRWLKFPLRVSKGKLMATDAKSTITVPSSSAPRGLKIFTYPKTIFIWPTFVAALLSAVIMMVTGNNTTDPHKVAKAQAAAAGRAPDKEVKPIEHRFNTPQNIAGLVFLAVFLLNMVIMSIDFPRFTIIVVIVGIVAGIFIFLYVNVYFNLLPPLVEFLEHVYTVANAAFYFWIATIILFTFGLIWATRYLDYWVILPNEILHSHGPFSDLERFPTMNLKFDKEIPDILEYALLGSGRLVLHVFGHPTSFILDNVLWIDSKEQELKKIMSRLDVRITTDQETAQGTN
jgi:hypothetical protein